MSENLQLELNLAHLSDEQQYLVRECAHQMQEVLDRYRNASLQALALELVSTQLEESITY